MSTVCRDCGHQQRPGRRCPRCTGRTATTPPPGRTDAAIAPAADGQAAEHETRMAALRAAGHWPTGLPTPVNVRRTTTH